MKRYNGISYPLFLKKIHCFTIKTAIFRRPTMRVASLRKYSDKNNYTFSLGIFCSQPALKSLVLAPLSLRFASQLVRFAAAYGGRGRFAALFLQASQLHLGALRLLRGFASQLLRGRFAATSCLPRLKAKSTRLKSRIKFVRVLTRYGFYISLQARHQVGASKSSRKRRHEQAEILALTDH